MHLEKKNDTNPSHSHLIFKFIIGFVGPTLGPNVGPTNPMVNLKLGCMEIARR
jgi:hypothetical protein